MKIRSPKLQAPNYGHDSIDNIYVRIYALDFDNRYHVEVRTLNLDGAVNLKPSRTVSQFLNRLFNHCLYREKAIILEIVDGVALPFAVFDVVTVEEALELCKAHLPPLLSEIPHTDLSGFFAEARRNLI